MMKYNLVVITDRIWRSTDYKWLPSLIAYIEVFIIKNEETDRITIIKDRTGRLTNGMNIDVALGILEERYTKKDIYNEDK